jgi:hypothetical protein
MLHPPAKLILMKRCAALLLLFASFSSQGQRERKQPNVVRLEVVELRAARDAGRITLDGEVRNTGTRELTRLVLMFDLLDADRKTISRRRGALEEAVLDPGDSSTFHFYVPDQARAVEVRVAAEQRGMEIEVAKPGPFAIE